MSKNNEKRPMAKDIEAETQPYPAQQSEMQRQPDSDLSNYQPAGKLNGKVALITGADSGIGRAVAIAYCMEGADIAIVYNENTNDAEETQRLCHEKAPDRKCLIIQCDVRQSKNCDAAVAQTVRELGGFNVLVNNAAYQMAQQSLSDLTDEQIERTFQTNIIAYMYMARAALPHLQDGDAIVNTGSIVGITGNKILLDYTATKGAIHAFTKSLALQLGEKNIRVNCVAPGPVWTPNIPGTMPEDEIENFGHEVALKRPGQPEELAPAYVYLGSSDSSFVTGAILEVTGGKTSGGG